MENYIYCYKSYSEYFISGEYYQYYGYGIGCHEIRLKDGRLFGFAEEFSGYFLTQAQDRERKINEILL